MAPADALNAPNAEAAEPGERLAKRVAAQAGCSRREAEQLIALGAVTVDGAPATQPQQRVRCDQQVEVAAGVRPRALAPATLLVHKPAGLAWGDAEFWAHLQRDAQDAHQGPHHGALAVPGLFAAQRCVAPLAPDESGLLVFTQVPGIARRLRDDAPLLEHEFSVEVPGAVDAGLLARLRPARASINRQSAERTGLRVVLNGAAPGQIDALCRAAGLAPDSVKRLRIGRLPLAGLALGQWRCLRPQERF